MQMANWIRWGGLGGEVRFLMGLGALVLCWSCADHGFAQAERSELGKRLQRYELEWETGTAERRAASAGPMQAAVSSFFSLRLQRAVEKLDDAWWMVAGKEDGPQRAWAAQRITGPRQVVSLESTTLTLRLEAFYETPAIDVQDLVVKFWITPRPRSLAIQRMEQAEATSTTQVTRAWSEAIKGVELSVADLAEGDYLVHAEIQGSEGSLQLLPWGWSRVSDFEARVAEVHAVATDRERELPDWLRATLLDQARLLDRLSQAEVQEIDYPAWTILQLAERLCRTPAEAASLLQRQAQQDDLWMTVANGRRKVATRIRSPEIEAPATGLPVLFLFHGAGGSENMFFETYGAGGAVLAGLERGWLVVATRQGLGGLSLDAETILNSLEAIFPIDRQRVFYLGHSMGAGQVATQVGLNPELPRAVAAIGGGGRPRNIESAAAVPWFVAAGSLDFGRSGAVSLSQSLKRAGGTNVVYREYKDVEHMVIVQAALAEAFQFFDQSLRTP